MALVAKTAGRRASRQLRSTPSTPADLTDMQIKLMSDFDAVFDEHQQERKPLSDLINDFQDKFSIDAGSLHLEVKSLLEAVGCQDDVIDAHIKVALPEAADAEVIGLRQISPFNFSYKQDSMWRGAPSNHTIRKLARSIIVSGFRSDSVIASRTLRLNGPFSLSLGDGSARALAAVIVWLLVAKRKAELSMEDTSMQKLVWSLSSVNVNFEKHGAGTPKDCLIAQVSRQNQAAAVQPVSTVQWLSMIRQFLGEPIGTSFKGTSQVQQVLEDLVESYNKHAEVMAYDVDAAPVRKKRRSKAGAVAGEEESEGGLKLSRRRVLGMKSFLSGANDEVLHELEQHIVVVGDYRTCAITDDILQLKYIYVGSKLPKEQLPSEAELTAMHAAGDVVKSWVQDESTMAEIRYDAQLSSEQFVLLWRKMIRTYESAIEGMTAPEAKQKERPSADDWGTARKVVQLWDLSMMPVVSQHLPASDFEALKRLVLESNTLDAELSAVMDRHPKYFHMNLISSIAADEAESVDSKHRRIADAHAVAEGATLSIFQEQLQMDWDTIKQASKSTACLGELLSWIEIRHRRAQAKIGEELVSLFCNKVFPLVSATEWAKASTPVSLLKQALSSSTVSLKAILVVDFNVPAARDVLKMPLMISAAGEMVKVLGAKDCVLMAIMPNAAKEGSKTTAFDDEVVITKQLYKAGFVTQDRVRQILDMPESICNKVSQLDWFVDSRLCMLGDISENFWANGSELCRTKVIVERACVSDPDDLIDSVSLEADEDLNTGGRYLEINCKLAQRGVDVAKAQIRALLTKTKRGCNEWLTPKTMVTVLDLTPFVGDRAVATLSLREEFGQEMQMSHCIFQIGKGVSAKHAEFTAKRVSQQVASLWFESKLVLADFQGHPVKVDTGIPEPTSDEFRMHPTAEIAYKGLRNLDFKVCSFVGGKVVLRPDKLATFATASHEVQQQINALKVAHEAKYASRLDACMAVSKKETADTREDVLEDLREEILPIEGLPDTKGIDTPLSTLDSIDTLKANFNTVECSSMVKGVKMFRDPAKHAIFLYSKSEDIVIKAGDLLGGIGGGSILDADANKTVVVPWLLPDGDKTYVQRAISKGDDDEGGGKKAKFAAGSLYSVLRELERKSTSTISLTAYGDASSARAAGRHEYTFKNSPGTEGFRNVEYVLSPVKPNAKVGSGNFFAPFVSRDNGLGAGALQLTWRLYFEPVAHTLRPNKVYVTARQRIELPKGKPVKVCWMQE